MRRKRRQKLTWFPTIGTANVAEGAQGNSPAREFSIVVPAAGTTNTLISPVTFDVPGEDNLLDPEAAGQLEAALGQEYLIKRIVGKLFLSRTSGAGTIDELNVAEIPSLLVGAGFFVARAGDSDTADTADQPIGTSSLAQVNNNYSPLNEGTIRAPWMWRRTWILGNRAIINQMQVIASLNGGGNNLQPGENGAQFPDTNALYGSVLDGPHFDIKSARRVRQDERLWFVVSVQNLPIGNATGSGNTSIVHGLLDFRILGALRKAHNKSSF